MSVASVNTKRLESASSGMIHAEGGWPKDVDYQEPSDVNRYRKKVEKVRASQQLRQGRVQRGGAADVEVHGRGWEWGGGGGCWIRSGAHRERRGELG